MTAKRFFWASVGAVLVCAGVANAGLIFVDFTSDSQGVFGNVGLEFHPFDVNGNLAPFLLTARSSIDNALPYDPFAPGSPGTIFFDVDSTGVQDEFGEGQAQINGSGAASNQELILTFAIAVPRDNLVLGLRSYMPGNGFLHRDDPAIFVHLTDGTVRIFDEFDVVSGGGQSGTLDLSVLLDLGDLVERIVVRETNDRMRLGSLQLVPAPGALALLGLAALAQRRRRRSAKHRP